MIRPPTLRNYRWQISAPPDQPTFNPQMGGVHPILQQILQRRGITDPAQVQAFLENRYLASRDPFLLTDMETAVARIRRALETGEVIVVYGDFDADGVTATVLLTEALRKLADDRRLIWPHIPDRVDEGYGLNLETLSNLREKGANLVVSVDCGIRSPVEVAHAQSIGLDVIVTDHHSLGREIPPALAVINPKRHDSDYPERMLAGVGIAFKLAQALRLAMPERAAFDDSDFLDLVAVGTVADLAPLLGENRKLVAEGLAVLNAVRRPGIAALLSVCGLEPGRLIAEDIGFALGPRINAAGRLSHAYDAARLLISTNPRTTQDLAQRLNELNRERQTLTNALSQKAEEMVDPEAPILIAADPSFRSGVVGLVASRLVEKTYRPAIIVEKGENESRGSCRSIPEFHITKALDELSDLLVRHGGHAQAAGFTIRNENVETFFQRMTELAQSELSGRDLRPSLAVDAQIGLDGIDWALQETLAQLEPTGYHNPAPLFMSADVEVLSHRAVGRDSAHLQLFLTDSRRIARSLNGSGPQAVPAIAFRQGEWAAAMPSRIDVVYTLNVNQWQGRSNLQLMIQDLRPAATEESLS